jgi:hypothetical protein
VVEVVVGCTVSGSNLMSIDGGFFQTLVHSQHA